VTTDCRNAELAVRDAAAAALQRSLTAPLRERIQKVRQEAEAKISELDRVLGGRQGDPG
jgi:ferritin-like metal-binding protein YciE